MGISLRHHVISLVAIFFMLLVGLLIGFGMSSQPRLTEQIASLNDQFRALQANLGRLDRQRHAYEQFGREVAPRLVSGRLVGQQVLLVVTAPRPDPSVNDQIAEAVQQAGGSVAGELTVDARFAKTAAATAGLADSPPDSREVRAAVASEAEALAQALLARDAAALSAEAKRKLIRLRDQPLALPEHYLVAAVAGAADEAQDRSEWVDRPLVAKLLDGGLRVVVCQRMEDVSSLGIYRSLSVTTVDNVDSPLGLVSLVYGLAGTRGHFGLGPHADDPFPPLQ